MVGEIREGALKLDMNPLPEGKCLGEPACNRHCTWSKQTSHSAVADWSGRNRINRTDVEVFADCGIGEIPVAQAVGPLECAAINQVEISRIIARAGDGS